MPTINVANGKHLRLKRGAVGVVNSPIPGNLLPNLWSISEAVADADTRKTHMRAYVPQNAAYQFGAYRGANRAGDLSQVAWMTWDTGLACYVWTSSGRAALDSTVYGRICMMPTGGSVNDRVWLVPYEDVKSFRASTAPGAADWTWNTNTTGTVKLTLQPPEWGRRRGTGGAVSINGGASWVPFTEAASGGLTEVIVSGLTDGVETPLSVKWMNANGDGPVSIFPVTAQAPVVLEPPSLSVVASEANRVVTITPTASGTPSPSVDLTAITVGGVDATSSVTGTGPWSAPVASSSSDTPVSYQVEATNSSGTVVRTGTLVVAADLTPPVDPPNGSILTAPTYAIAPDPTVHGRLIVTVTSVPASTATLWARVTIAGGATTTVQIGTANTTGTFSVDFTARAGHRAAVAAFGRNANGDGPSGTSYQMWIPSTPSVTARINPTVLRPGDTAILTLGTWGFPHPEVTNNSLTLDGVPVAMVGLGNVRTFLIPNDASGKTLALAGAVLSPLGSASHSVSKTVAPAVVWKTPVTIATRSELDTALLAATGGEVFRLAAGDFGAMIWPLLTADPIRITSQTGRSASFTSLLISGSARGNVYFDSVTLGGCNVAAGSKTSRVTNCLITGRSDFNSNDFVCTGNEFQFADADFGVTLGDQSGSFFSRNSYYDAGADQFRVTSAITDSVFERQTHVRISEYAQVKHPDCMQIYGQTGARTPTRIAIRYNRMYDVNGAQGIFMTDSRSVMGYCDCVVHDNAVRAAYTNKIAVSHLSRCSIVTRNSTRGQLMTNDAYGGKVFNNLCSLNTAGSPEFPTIKGDNYEYGQFTDANTIYSGDGSTIAGYIPQSGLNIPERYGVTTFARIEGGATVSAVSPPIISGPKYVGQTLNALGGDYAAAISISGQWYADGVAILGATGMTYVVQSGDIGKVVSYRDTGYGLVGSSATQTSNAIGPVVAVPPAPPSYTLIGDAAITNTAVSGAAKTFDFWPVGGANATKQHLFLAAYDQISSGKRTPTGTPLVWVDSAGVVGAALVQDSVYSATPGGLRKYMSAGHGIPASATRYARIQNTGSGTWSSWAGASLIRIDSAIDTWIGAPGVYSGSANTLTASITVTPAARIFAFAYGLNGAMTMTGATQISERQDSGNANTRYVTGTATSAYGGTVTISAANANGLILVAVTAG